MEGWKKLIVVGLCVTLGSALLITVLIIAQRVEERCRILTCPYDWCSCFVVAYHYHVLGFDVSAETHAYLMGWLPVFVVLGVSLILAGLMMKGGKTQSNRFSA